MVKKQNEEIDNKLWKIEQPNRMENIVIFSQALYNTLKLCQV